MGQLGHSEPIQLRGLGLKVSSLSCECPREPHALRHRLAELGVELDLEIGFWAARGPGSGAPDEAINLIEAPRGCG